MNETGEKNNVLPMPGPAPMARAEDYFTRLKTVLHELSYSTVDQITTRLLRAYEENRAVYLLGNGGSAALASHVACDLGKGTAMDGKRRFRVVALTDNVPLITAWANDASYDDVFAEQLKGFVQEGDVVFAISGSGNSRNVLKCLRLAQESRAYIIGLTGFEGGTMKDLCHLCLIVPSDNMQFIEDMHVSISHAIFTSFRSRLANSSRGNIGTEGRDRTEAAAVSIR